MKSKKLLAVIIAAIMLTVLAGCNYIQRPSGAVNNAEDISDKLAVLLKTPTFTYDPPTHRNETRNETVTDEKIIPNPDKTDNGNGEEPGPQEPTTEPDPVLTPYTSEYDPANVLSKITVLVQAMKNTRILANSATGVSDELLSGRQVKIAVPDNFPLDPDDPAIHALATKYNCAIQIRRAYSGSRYTSEARRAVLAGDRGDLMYADNAIWGDIHFYTQAINSFVNFDLGEKLKTYNFDFSKNYYIRTSNQFVNYYVAAGIGAPYLLVFNPDKVKAGDVAEDTLVSGTEKQTLRAIKGTDPVSMYNNRTWSISAFDAFLKANTSGNQVGLASKIDDLKGLDIWYGMNSAAGFEIISDTGATEVSLTADDNKTVDRVQQWYWSTKGADNKNFVGSLVQAANWQNGTVFQKMLGTYSGSDAISSYAFVGCEIGDVVNDLQPVAGTAKWDFVSYPYGITSEQTNRAFSESDFALLAAGEPVELDTGDKAYLADPHVAGWTGGFAVLKTCQTPSVALRIGEELIKIWKAQNETPFLNLLDDTQKTRYEDMKKNIAVSSTRAWAEKAADVNAVYPGISKYINGRLRNGTNSTENRPDPDTFTNDRTNFLALTYFDNNPGLAVSPIYHKNTKTDIYTPSLQTDWTSFISGAFSADSTVVKDTGSVGTVLNAVLLPGTVLFNW